LYAITAKILKIPDLTDSKEMLVKMQELSNQTVVKSRELLYIAAKISEGDPEKAKEVYPLTDLANTAVLNAVNMIGANARMTKIQELLASLEKPDSESIN
jgi:hypothetical protein